MTNQRFDSAPEFNIDDEPVVIQRAEGSVSDLLVFKSHTGSTLASIASTGAISSTALSTISDLTITNSASLPSSTSIGTITSSELGYLDGVTSAIQTQIDTKAPLASAALTGTPTAPTASAGTNTTQIATTAFVRTEVANLVDAAPAALDTLNELAAALGDDPNYATTISSSLALKAPLESPSFTGTPSGPTASSGTSTTQLATTAFVSTAVGAVLPAGMMVPYAGSAAPSGWLLCGGQEVAIADYGALYTAIGTTYGSLTNGSGGAGSTHFRLPDMRGRIPAGHDFSVAGSTASRLTAAVSNVNGTLLGASGGEQALHQHQHANTATFTGTSNQSTGNHSQDHSHSGTTNYMDANASHSHVVPTYSVQAPEDWPQRPRFTGNGVRFDSAVTNSTDTNHRHTFGTSGANQGHTHTYTAGGVVTMSNVNAGTGQSQNVQPTLIVNYIIKV